MQTHQVPIIYEQRRHLTNRATVLCTQQNIEPSCRICHLPRNFYVSVKFCRKL